MKRESNYDLLRIICAVAVIVLHVSGTWFLSAVEQVAEYGVNVHEIPSAFMICVYNSISMFPVPCFIMLSGAFILDNEKNREYKSFYSRSFAKIGVPTIVFSILYILYRIPMCFIGEKTGVSELVSLLKDILIGMPMSHMWYIYMLIGIYALVPVVIRFKESITEKMFYKVSVVFLVLASVCQWTSTVRLMWDIGQSFEYLGYFMAGYCIRKIFAGRKNNVKAFISILAGILLELCVAGLKYKQIIAGISETDLKYQFLSTFCSFIALAASVLIFIGFTLLNVKKQYADMSGITFYIYLIHAGVWDFVLHVLKLVAKCNICKELNGGIWIPVFVIAVFVISCVLSKCYLWIWTKLDKEKKITDYLLKIARLRTV